jgi:ketosteroid isomerase-like protein
MTEQDRLKIQAALVMYSGREAELANIAQDIVWHVPGHNPASGDYHGYEEYTQLMSARMAPLSRWDFTLEDVMVNGNYVVTTWQLEAERKDKSVQLRGAHILRFNEQGKIVEGWGFANDQDAWMSYSRHKMNPVRL